MDDFVIDACRWHVDAESKKYKQRALEHFRDRYIVLLDFFREESLLVNPLFGQDVSNWITFELRRFDLTDEGYELVKICHGNWNPSFGQGQTKRHLIQWRRKLAQLRSQST